MSSEKKHDGFIQYWSNSVKCIVISCYGSLFVDHCPSETLVEHFFEFKKKNQFGYKLFSSYWIGQSKCKPKTGFRDVKKSFKIRTN